MRTSFVHKLFWIYKQELWELDPSKYSLGTAEFDRTLSKTITLIWHFTKTTNIGGNSKASQQIQTCFSNMVKMIVKMSSSLSRPWRWPLMPWRHEGGCIDNLADNLNCHQIYCKPDFFFVRIETSKKQKVSCTFIFDLICFLHS